MGFFPIPSVRQFLANFGEFRLTHNLINKKSLTKCEIAKNSNNRQVPMFMCTVESRFIAHPTVGPWAK